jgi:hypothetical protein
VSSKEVKAVGERLCDGVQCGYELAILVYMSCERKTRNRL